MGTSEAWFQTNGEWKKSVSNEVKGPAPFYDPKDYGDETYVRVTAEEARAGKPCRVYTPGVHDMLRAGHTRQLRQAKKTVSQTSPSLSESAITKILINIRV